MKEQEHAAENAQKKAGTGQQTTTHERRIRTLATPFESAPETTSPAKSSQGPIWNPGHIPSSFANTSRQDSVPRLRSGLALQRFATPAAGLEEARELEAEKESDAKFLGTSPILEQASDRKHRLPTPDLAHRLAQQDRDSLGRTYSQYALKNTPPGATLKWHVEFEHDIDPKIFDKIQRYSFPFSGIPSTSAGIESSRKQSFPLTPVNDFVQVYEEPHHPYHVVCDVIGPDGKTLTTATYTEIPHTKGEVEENEQVENYKKSTSKAYLSIDPDTVIPLKAAHINAATKRITELNLYFGRHINCKDGNCFTWLIVDATPGAEVVSFAGIEFPGAMYDFIERNRYAPGYFSFINPNSGRQMTHPTNGKSALGTMADSLETTSGILSALGTLASLFPATEILAPIFFVASSALQATASSTKIVEELNNADPSTTSIGIAASDIVLSLFDAFEGIAKLNQVDMMSALPKVAGGRYLIRFRQSVQVAHSFLITVEAVENIKEILKNRRMDNAATAEAVVDTLVDLSIQHAITYLDIKEGNRHLQGGKEPSFPTKRYPISSAEFIPVEYRKQYRALTQKMRKFIDGVSADDRFKLLHGITGNLPKADAFLNKYKEGEEALRNVLERTELNSGTIDIDEFLRLAEEERKKLQSGH